MICFTVIIVFNPVYDVALWLLEERDRARLPVHIKISDLQVSLIQLLAFPERNIVAIVITQQIKALIIYRSEQICQHSDEKSLMFLFWSVLKPKALSKPKQTWSKGIHRQAIKCIMKNALLLFLRKPFQY